MLHQYPIVQRLLLLNLIILLKDKKLESEGYVTVLIEVNFQGGCLMERYSSREPFGFSISVLFSTIRPTNVNKLAMIVLQCIMTPLFLPLDIFALFVQYLFSILFVIMMTD